MERTSPSRGSPATNVSKNLDSDLERGKKKRGGLRRGVRTSCETKLIRRHLAGWPTRMFKPFAVKGVGARSRACSQHLAFASIRSEERRVGKECVSTCRSRWSPYHYKKKKTKNEQNMKL